MTLTLNIGFSFAFCCHRMLTNIHNQITEAYMSRLKCEIEFLYPKNVAQSPIEMPRNPSERNTKTLNTKNKFINITMAGEFHIEINIHVHNM